VIALVATRDTGPVAIRLVSLLRAVAAAGLACLVIAAGVLAYSERVGDAARGRPPGSLTGTWLLSLWVVSGVIAAYLGGVYLVSRRVERPRRLRSPWDMTDYHSWREHRGPVPGRTGDSSRGGASLGEGSATFDDAVRKHRFNSPAIGLESAEAWHEVYDLTEKRHAEIVDALTDVLAVAAGRVAFPCADLTRCPRRESGTCFADQSVEQTDTPRPGKASGAPSMQRWARSGAASGHARHGDDPKPVA
jgi:hypothetical protein